MPSFSSDSYCTSFTNSNRTEPPSIRDQLETVIEMMGPDTPHFTSFPSEKKTMLSEKTKQPLFKNSSDADNEDSAYTNTMTAISSVLKRKLSHSAPESPRDVIKCLYCSQPRFRNSDLKLVQNKFYSLHNQKPVPKKSQPQLGLVKTINNHPSSNLSMSNINRNRVDVYYFDHGNSAYYKTNDNTPVLMSEIIAEKTELYTTKFWAQVFGTVHIGFAFITSFVLQMFRFVLFSVVRPLTVGTTQTLSDYFLKPFLAVVFNGLLQPPLVFLYNVLKSVRDAVEPMSETLGMFLQQLGQIFRWFRLVSVTQQIVPKENGMVVEK